MTEVLLTATVLLCAVILIRGLLGRFMSAGLRYALWGLVLFRLLVPVNFFTSPASVMNAVAGARPIQAEAAGAHEQTGSPVLTAGAELGQTGPYRGAGTSGQQTPAPILSQAPAAAPVLPDTVSVVPEPGGSGETGGSEPQPTPEAGRTWTARQILGAIWLCGAAGVGTWFLLSNLRFSAGLRKNRVRLEVAACPLPVYRADHLSSPCLAGLFRPAIYVNAAALADEDTLRHVLTHELCHRRHGDNWWALLRGMCLSLWWFHPLVWAAAVLSRRDCELSCDAAAVKKLGEEERIPYGRTLVTLVARRPVPADLLRASTAMTAGKREIKERVIHVATYRRMKKTVLALVTALALTAGLCTFTGAVAQSSPTMLPYSVSPDPTLVLQDLDLSAVVIPDFDWKGSAGDYRREVAIRWAAAYGQQFYALPQGHPWRAADVKVVPYRMNDTLGITNHLSSDGKAYKLDNVTAVSGWFTLAIKPVGGLEAVRPLFKGGVPRGTGELADYALLPYHYRLDREEAPFGGLQWVGNDNAKDVTPNWNRNPPPDPDTWTEEQIAAWWVGGPPAQLASKAEGDDPAAWQAAGEKWANNFVNGFLSITDNGNPLKADDAQVLIMELEGYDSYEKPQTIWFHLRYAFRPVWGFETARKLLSQVDAHANWNVAGLEDYFVLDAVVSLQRDERGTEGLVFWMTKDLEYTYGSNYDRQVTNLPSTIEVTPRAGAPALENLDPTLASVTYGPGQDETRMYDNIYSQWAYSFGQQFFQLPKEHPLYADRVEVITAPSLYPTKTTTSGAVKVINGVTDTVGFRFYPVNGQDKAEEYLKGVCWLGTDDRYNGCVYVYVDATLVRQTAADGSTTWVCTGAPVVEQVRDYGQTGNLITLPARVEPRAGWSIDELDFDAVCVPDDGRGDLKLRWLMEYAREFYALPQGNPWRASDVQLRYGGEDRLCLAVKPAGGTAALEPWFPNGCPKGSGDLEGYILLQYGLSLRKETVAAFGEAPVWVCLHCEPLWCSQPPAPGSKDWVWMTDGTDKYEGWGWPGELAGKYTSAELADPGSAAWERAARLWVQDYMDNQLKFDNSQSHAGYPLLSDDVKLLNLELKYSNQENGTTKILFGFQYAFRPIWGMEVVQAFLGEDMTLGAGELSGYAVRTCPGVVLEYRPSERGWPGMWFTQSMSPTDDPPQEPGWRAIA